MLVDFGCLVWRALPHVTWYWGRYDAKDGFQYRRTASYMRFYIHSLG